MRRCNDRVMHRLQVKGLLDKGGVLMAKTGGYLANVRSRVCGTAACS